MVHVSCNDGRELLRIAKQEVGEKRNVAGFSCLKDEIGTMKASVDDWKRIWKEDMEKLMNGENEWGDSIDTSQVHGALWRIEVEEV